MLILILAVLFFNRHAKATNTSTRIVNGNEAPDGGIPYQVSLRLGGSHFCGGSILKAEWILSASHCFDRIRYVQYITALVGTNDLKSGGDEVKIDKIVKHPDYVQKQYKNDIALLKTLQRITFNERVKPIPLPEQDTEPGANLLVSGWGQTKENPAEFPDKLQMLNVTAISVEECKNQLGKFIPIDETKLCTSKQEGTSACSGDSGGPLVEGTVLVGVASFVVTPCATFDYPDGYTRVFQYKDWITKNIS
ncbi:unnamed protein product [Leptosia nina]|uniref:Peptidase S1 domain-containing protein n=1 Tax=Leptosia nina TaxID=320188 RepID=A0AAV1JEH0_9NEOP